VFTTETAILAELELFRFGLLVFGCCVILLLTLGARKGNDVSHLTIPLPMMPLRAVKPATVYGKLFDN
jgi:hypothetical protein